LIKDAESLAADQNQAMQMNMMDKLGPAAVTQLGKGMATGAFQMPNISTGAQSGAQSGGMGVAPAAAAPMMGQ
jgi:hypothetical protein